MTLRETMRLLEVADDAQIVRYLLEHPDGMVHTAVEWRKRGSWDELRRACIARDDADAAADSALERAMRGEAALADAGALAAPRPLPPRPPTVPTRSETWRPGPHTVAGRILAMVEDGRPHERKRIKRDTMYDTGCTSATFDSSLGLLKQRKLVVKDGQFLRIPREA